MITSTSNGINSFNDQSHIGEFAQLFTALASGSDDQTNGVSFKDLRALINASLSDPSLTAKTNQRIANKQQAGEKKKNEEGGKKKHHGKRDKRDKSEKHEKNEEREKHDKPKEDTNN